ncbi:hypothetical protein ACWN8V_03655 [Vagococcus elongatus]|uniref:Uncharacterized protein n=1 Tax=Vagococcus elongatus TaxID=180344 RepID=A0A430AZU1_9ENTE|nr:hypothetical protein [Vagococcus elongatus]RSU13521.1 hypothetical protein CBF29_04515 [Vagococcus elongatus]
MEKEMQQLETIARKTDENQSVLLEKESKLIRDAKQRAHKLVQDMNHDFDQEESTWRKQVEEEVEAYKISMAQQVENEIEFYRKQYEENKSYAREELIKEIFGYGHSKDE